MSRGIVYWTETPTIQAMCKDFGDKWETLPIDEMTAVLAVLAITSNELVMGDGRSPNLVEIASVYGFKISDGLSKQLQALDAEIGARDLLNLIQGIASLIPVSELQGGN